MKREDRVLVALVVLLVVALRFASFIPVKAEPIGREDTLLFVSGFETGDFSGWNGVGGNPYDMQIFSWWLCPNSTGLYCARAGAYGNGLVAYLIDMRPAAQHDELVWQWDASIYTEATSSQPAVIFAFYSDTGVTQIMLRTAYLSGKPKIRIACRDGDTGTFVNSLWTAMPESWNGQYGARFRVGWHRGPADVGGCWYDMTDSAGNRSGSGMLLSTGDYNPGSVRIGVVTNVGTGTTLHWMDNYSDWWIN